MTKRFGVFLCLCLISFCVFSVADIKRAEAALDGSGSSLVGWWKLNDGSGTTVTDSSGNSRTGSASGTPVWGSGQINGGLTFDGVDDKVAINDFAEADGTNTLTVSAWVQPSVAASSSAFTIVSKTRSTSGFSGWVLHRGADEKYTFYIRDASSAASAVSDTIFADTLMHHVVGVYNGTDARVYVDGVLANATPPTFTGTLLNGTQKVCIGQTNGGGGTCDGSGSLFFAGVIDDVKIYNRALSAAEVDQLYDNGIAGIETVTTPTVTTEDASSITSTTATANGNITSGGGDTVTARGFAYGLTTDYSATTTDSGSYGTGAFSASLTSLTCNTTYHVRAYATNAAGTSFGSDESFTTGTCSAIAPTVTTAAASSITSTTTLMNGSITDEGNASSTIRGFTYGLTTSYGATTTESGTFGTGSFSATASDLTCNTLYHFRAYATNPGGTGYGTDGTFTTSTCSPTVTSFTIPSTSDDVIVSISTFTASDNVSVTGYLITDTSTTPTAEDSDWSLTPPSSYTFRTSGHKTLYAWAKDADDNISASVSDTVVISLSEYTPPIGIPDPSDSFGDFGEINRNTPDWPASWEDPSTTATAGYYFIDNSDGACTNTSNTYGHPDVPRCDPPEGSLAEGAYLYFHGGTYTPALSGGDRYDWCGAGTASNPIWITGNPENQPVFTEKVYLGYGCNSSYTVFENMTMEGASASINIQPLTDGQNVDHFIVRNVTRTGTGDDGDLGGIGVSISQSSDTFPTSLVSYIVIYDVNISNIGYIGELGVGGDETGVYMGYHTDYVWVLDSIIHHVGADSVAGSHYSNDTDRLAENYFIGRNILYQNGENSIDLKVIHGSVISENIMYGPYQDEGGAAVVVHYGANSLPTTDTWFLYNKIYDAGSGILSTYGEDLYFIGNEISNIHTNGTEDPLSGACMGGRSTSGTIYLIDNTCYDYDSGIVFPSGTLSSGDDVQIHGNIFSERSLAEGYEINIAGSSESQYVNLDYNLFNNSIGSAAFNWGGASRTLSYMQNTAIECTHCTEDDPEFEDADGSDFALESTSPAINSSVEHGAYDDFFDIYAIDIENDILGTSRPQGGAWDMGAYEFEEDDEEEEETANSGGSSYNNNNKKSKRITYGRSAADDEDNEEESEQDETEEDIEVEENTETTTIPATPSPFTKDLYLGMSDPEVKLLQQYLNAHGYPVTLSGPGSAGNETQFFGAATKAALIKYQIANGITPADGYFRPESFADTSVSQATPSSAPLSASFTRDLQLGDIGDDIRALQELLIARNAGPAAQALAAHGSTGIFGPLTQDALIELQRSLSIVPAVGYFGPKTRAAVE